MKRAKVSRAKSARKAAPKDEAIPAFLPQFFAFNWDMPVMDRRRLPVVKRALSALYGEKMDALIDGAILRLAEDAARGFSRGYRSKQDAETAAKIAEFLVNETGTFEVVPQRSREFPFITSRKFKSLLSAA